MVISEKWDRRAQKYATASVPFPFDGRDTYERSIRQPLGADFNTNASFRCKRRGRKLPFILSLDVLSPSTATTPTSA